MEAGNARRPSGRGVRRAAWALAGAALLSALAGAAGAMERVALVIGNGQYEHVRDLANPEKDAADVGAALGRLGFAVTHLENADYRDLLQGLQEFEEAAARSEIAVVFYAGHGIEIDKRNYLVPVEARLATDRAVKYETVPLDMVMAAAEVASTLGLVILDACRDNPFLAMMQGTGLARSVDRGLARVEPRGTGKSMLVAYSAREGTAAADGEPGRNSPYVEALLKHLETPSLHVGDLFIEVRKEVLARPGSQTPVEYGALVEKVYLASGAAPPPPPADTAKAAEIILPDGLTLADWALLAEDRLKAGDHARLLDEADAHLRAHGRTRPVEAVRDRAVSGLIKDVRVETREDAPGALERIARLMKAAGVRPELLRLKARAHGLLGDHAAAEAAHLQWLRSAPQSHPDRRAVLSALARARAAREAARRFSELLGRPFSPEWKEDSVGWTDLHYAALLDLPEAVAALCDAGMAADARLKTGFLPFRGDLGRTLSALGHGHFKKWRANGETPLMIASYANAHSAALGLAACGADINAANSSGRTPLRYAVWRNSFEAAELLIERGADVNATDRNGYTPLHAAVGRNNLAAELLIERGADVNATDGMGFTPLHIAVFLDATEAAKLLIDSGGDVNATDGDGRTPLHDAVGRNNLVAAKLLIDSGGGVNATDGDGRTPLHDAAFLHATEAAKLLIDSGGGVNATDGYGRTPLDYALRGGHREMQEVLRSHVEKAASSEKVERRLALSGEQRYLIQIGLAWTGYDPGPADGVFGRRTREALRAWQRSRGLDVTGHPTREQSERLVELGRAAAARGYQ